MQKMIEEARILTDTYCDGVGIYAFRENSDGTGYEPAPKIPGVSERVTSLDSVLELISANIRQTMAANNNRVPPAVRLLPGIEGRNTH